MILKFIKKIFVAILLFSVLIHAIIFFENFESFVISRATNTTSCEEESPLYIYLIGSRCSHISSYLRPALYFGLLSCKLKGRKYEISSHGYSCLVEPIPLLIDPDFVRNHPDFHYNPAPPDSRIEIAVKEIKSKFSVLLENYYTISHFPISAVLFLSWMLADCIVRPISKKGAWIALILFGYVYGGLIYYFIGRKRLRVSTTNR